MSYFTGKVNRGSSQKVSQKEPGFKPIWDTLFPLNSILHNLYSLFSDIKQGDDWCWNTEANAMHGWEETVTNGI